ncbi:HBR080Wp [Eremothecium sinecaudum]|uniref:HBR080Wp n=1 Tax=Eremothecium sinecaudum TaxID=45286 RepID=A0A125RDZ3_9SACH|nr:HBR080Wp [Eremothecium sinecaudum]AMD18981.1 HBR080Wp [Eremothecium sinecaudum]
MNIPELPPKPKVRNPETVSLHFPRPEKCHLLTANDLQSLLRERDKLQLYVSKFVDGEDIKVNAQSYKNALNMLGNAYVELEAERKKMQDEMDRYYRLEFQYHEKWQELDYIVKDQFDTQALKNRLKTKVKELEADSELLENQQNFKDVDSFISEYLSFRTAYHLHNEKLQTFDFLGILRQ